MHECCVPAAAHAPVRRGTAARWPWLRASRGLLHCNIRHFTAQVCRGQAGTSWAGARGKGGAGGALAVRSPCQCARRLSKPASHTALNRSACSLNSALQNQGEKAVRRSGQRYAASALPQCPVALTRCSRPALPCLPPPPPAAADAPAPSPPCLLPPLSPLRSPCKEVQLAPSWTTDQTRTARRTSRPR